MSDTEQSPETRVSAFAAEAQRRADEAAAIKKRADARLEFAKLRALWGRSLIGRDECPEGYKEFCDASDTAELRRYVKLSKPREARHDSDEDIDMDSDAKSVVSRASLVSRFSDATPVPDTPRTERAAYPKRRDTSPAAGGSAGLQVGAGAANRLIDAVAFRLRHGTGNAPRRGKPYNRGGRPHGHGSEKAQLVSLKLKIESFCSGGPQPTLSEHELKVIPDDEADRLNTEIERRRKDKALQEIRRTLKANYVPSPCLSPNTEKEKQTTA
ncbi:hypothetical protein EXIGLDRAFT_752285 [Exidia glandulosa HHB12029]|uniref:Uncharacterized protein n=1 Tax=Exidia glandulosa HHB12029 TaxID=1314781 RepID=A0A165ENL6_EXIGL|nr:hypothetical protein EXIGLDRAFT_752285 [Exidia glandulosa HHB12029]